MRKRQHPVFDVTLLSAREIEVLRQLSCGLTNREIATRLFITEGTIKGHLHRIFRKLEVRNRTAAAAKARELGVT
jgi:DNA-binding NarL/FixJ family response regulator